MSFRLLIILLMAALLLIGYKMSKSPRVKRYIDRAKKPHEFYPEILFWEAGDHLRIGDEKFQVYQFLSVNDEGVIVCQRLGDHHKLTFSIYDHTILNLTCQQRQIDKIEENSQEYMSFLTTMKQEYLKIKSGRTDDNDQE